MAKIAKLRNVDNVRILNSIRNSDRSLAYENRVPEVTQANIQQTFNDIMNTGPLRNEFIDALINQFAVPMLRTNLWQNKLARFKSGDMIYGSGFQEVVLGYAQGYVYDIDRDYLEEALFGRYDTPARSVFHRVNRKVYYPVTIDEIALRQAFESGDNGLQDFVNALLQTQQNADNLDEYKAMVNLFTEYDKANAFWRIHIPDVVSLSSSTADAKAALRVIKAASGNLEFPSTRYNAAGFPAHAQDKQLHLFCTPEFSAALDVEALAGLFNAERADVSAHITTISSEDWGLDDVQAILTTEDFFIIRDTFIDLRQQPNAIGLHTNYFYHHQQIVSASPFVPAIAFTTGPGSVIEVEENPVTALGAVIATDSDLAVHTELQRGHLYQLSSNVTGGDSKAVRFETNFVSPRSYISSTGVIHPAIDEEFDEIEITNVSVEDNAYQGTTTFSIVGAKAVLWPDPHVEEDDDLDGLLEVSPKDPTLADGEITIPRQKGVIYKIAGVTVRGKVPVTVDTTVTASAAAGYELAADATTTWNIDVA